MELRREKDDIKMSISSNSNASAINLSSPPFISTAEIATTKKDRNDDGTVILNQPLRSPPIPAPTLPTFISYATGGSNTKVSTSTIKAAEYKECLKNHAVSTGSHVLDGCGEFMPSGEEGLKCGACGCHRSFHRRELNGHLQSKVNYYKSYHPNGFLSTSPFQLLPQTVKPITTFGGGGGLTTDSSSEEFSLRRSNADVFASPQFAPSKKRVRTKFTSEQKVKMLEFAEKIGWRIQKQDEAAVRLFCAQVGVKRHVLRVWIHNKKQAMKRENTTFCEKMI